LDHFNYLIRESKKAIKTYQRAADKFFLKTLFEKLKNYATFALLFFKNK